jgi:hypothetical protein
VTPLAVFRDRQWISVDLVFRRSNGGALRGDGKGGTNDLLRRALDRANVRGHTSRDLRHLAVGLLLSICDPREVAQIVGHSSYRMTLDTYAPRLRELLDRTAINLEPIYRHLNEIGYHEPMATPFAMSLPSRETWMGTASSSSGVTRRCGTGSPSACRSLLRAPSPPAARARRGVRPPHYRHASGAHWPARVSRSANLGIRLSHATFR